MTFELEISGPVHWADVPNSGVNVKISVTDKQCQDLAKLLGVVSIPSVEADFTITRWHSSGLKVKVDIRAKVDQKCVVSLATISSDLNEQAEWRFKPAARKQKNTDRDVVVEIDPLGEDPADILIDGKVDLGHLLTEHLCLMIDPFLRSATVDFDALYTEVQQSSKTQPAEISPFAILEQYGKTDKK